MLEYIPPPVAPSTPQRENDDVDAYSPIHDYYNPIPLDDDDSSGSENDYFWIMVFDDEN